MKKFCGKCKIEKPLSEFCKDKHRKDGLDSTCKICRKNYRQLPEVKKNTLKYNRTIKRKESFRKKDLKLKYGISLKDYDQMLEAQNGKCKICGTKKNGNKRFFVDHDHESRKVRGLLCTKCNTLIGCADDNISILLNSIKYLKDFK